MARYKAYDYSQGKFIPIDIDRQILPGTFEYSLHYLIDNEIDVSVFDARYRNNETGAPVYDPAVLLKIILYAYSRGITSSRKIAQCCLENVIFMAVGADGLLIEVHPEPEKVLSDGIQSLKPEKFYQLMEEVKSLERTMRTEIQVLQ
jgi:transposase